MTTAAYQDEQSSFICLTGSGQILQLNVSDILDQTNTAVYRLVFAISVTVGYRGPNQYCGVQVSNCYISYCGISWTEPILRCTG